jgi:hypothetical protein
LVSNEMSFQMSFHNDDEEIGLNDLEVLEDFYETPLERMQKLVDTSKSELLEDSSQSEFSLGNEQLGLLIDDDDYERRISDEPDEGEFSSDEYITPLQRTRLTRSGSQEQLQLWDGDGDDDDENKSSSRVGLNDREEYYHRRNTDAPNTDAPSASREYYPHGPMIWDDDHADIGHEEIIATFQQMIPQQHQANQEQLSAFWEKVTGTFMLDPSKARTTLETVESGDELSGDELRSLYDDASSSDESTSDDDDELSEDEHITEDDEAHMMEPVPQVPPSPWQKVSAMLMSPQVAVQKFVNIHRAPNLDLKEKQEPKEESDESESEDFQPFMLKIPYPRRNSETSELSQGTASLKLSYNIYSENTKAGTDIDEQDRWDSRGCGLSLESEEDADDGRTAPHTTLEGSNISKMTMNTLNKTPVNTPKAVWSVPNHHSVPKIHPTAFTESDSGVDDIKDHASVHTHTTSFTKLVSQATERAANFPDVDDVSESINSDCASASEHFDGVSAVKEIVKSIGALPLGRGSSFKSISNSPETIEEAPTEESAVADQHRPIRISTNKMRRRASNASGEESFGTIRKDDIGLSHQHSNRSISPQGKISPNVRGRRTLDPNSLVSPGMRGMQTSRSFDRNSLVSPGMGGRRTLDPNSLVSPGMGGRPLVSPGMSARPLVSPGISRFIKPPAVGGGRRTLDWTSPALMSPAVVPRPPVRAHLQRDDSVRSQLSAASHQTYATEQKDKTDNRWSYWQDSAAIASPYTPAQASFVSSAVDNRQKKAAWAGMGHLAGIDTGYLDEASVTSQGVNTQNNGEITTSEEGNERNRRTKGKRLGFKKFGKKVRSGLKFRGGPHN